MLLIILLTSLYKITFSIKEYSSSKKVYQEIKDKKTEVNLSTINSDYIGWINIKNTTIDYPIVKGENNEFYLTRDFNKQYLKSGSIFMDYRNDGFQDENVIIYGHNMKDTSMFGLLKKYKNLEYLQNNKYISIITKENKELIYKIFSVYITRSDDIKSISVKFNNKNEFLKYIKEICEKSIYDLNEDIKSTDKILTLATCSYEFKDARLIIHAKLIN